MASSSSSEGACWSCGNSQAKRFCRSCGADSGCPACGEIALGRFCRSCGFDVASNRSIPPIPLDPHGPDSSEADEVPIAADEQPRHLDLIEPNPETSGLIGVTVVDSASPDAPAGPPPSEKSLEKAAEGDRTEPMGNSSPTRSRRKIFVAAVVLLVVGLIASAVVLRSQDSDPQEVAAATSTSTEPVQTIPTTTTTTISPAELMAAIRAKCVSARDEEMLSQKTQLRSLGAVTSDPVEISADPLIWTYNVWTQLNGDRSLRGRVECQPDGSVVATYRPV
jgi:hypothetical protein